MMTTPRSGVQARTVTEADTAAAWGPVFPPAASTPFVLGLAEIACHAAVEADLEEGQLTVGTAATIEHLAPSPVGAELVARATLLDRSGSRLGFEVEVYDGDDRVAHVRHTRAIVGREKILALLG